MNDRDIMTILVFLFWGAAVGTLFWYGARK